jgi:hypothetical protein
MGKVAKLFIVLSLIIVGLLASSCGAIPGAKECDAVVNSFMTAAAAKDADSAYDCMCSGAATQEDVESFIQNRYDLFQGFQEVKMRCIEVHYSETEGDTAEYQGEAGYSRDFTTWVEAELVKEDDEWKIWGITITPSE